MCICWVENDTEIIDPVMQQLEQEGFQILRIDSVRETLARLTEVAKCELIVLDLIIPDDRDGGVYDEEYGGIKLLRKLRKEHGVDVPVVIFSVVGKAKVQERISDLAVAWYFEKPIVPREFTAKVHEILGSNSE
jgi:DNA-binding response OmpR family regulator